MTSEPKRDAPRQARAKGRSRDAAATRRRILDAAHGEFTNKGLSGARVDKIAARANINKRMIYVYFGNKEKLFLAVLEEAYGAIRDAERKLRLTDLPPRRAIEKLATFTWDYYVRNPGFLRLVNSENLHRARHLRHSERIKAIHPPFVEMLRALLERGAREGVFRPGLDPIQTYMSIAALGYYYLTNRFTSSVIYDADLSAKSALEARHAVIIDTVLRYVLADPNARPDAPADAA